MDAKTVKIEQSKKNELIERGNAAVREALKDKYVIVKVDADSGITILTHDNRDERDGGDKMVFLPTLECSEKVSAIVFSDPDAAKSAIEEILKPQEDADYKVFQFKDLDGAESSEGGTGLEFDDEDEGTEGNAAGN